MSEHLLTRGQKKFFAVLIPIAFLLDVVAMAILKLQGGDATALVGGTAVFILLILSLVAHKQKGWNKQQAILLKDFNLVLKYLVQSSRLRLSFI